MESDGGINVATDVNTLDNIFTDANAADSSYDLSNVTVPGSGWDVTTISEDFIFPYVGTKPPSSLASIEVLTGGSIFPSVNPSVLETVATTARPTSAWRMETRRSR